MENKVKVIESDGKAYEISDAVRVYVGINSASVEKSDGTLILIPFSAIKSMSYPKILFRLGDTDVQNERKVSKD